MIGKVRIVVKEKDYTQKPIGFVTSTQRYMQLKRLSMEREMSVSEVIRQSLADALGPVKRQDILAAEKYAMEQ